MGFACPSLPDLTVGVQRGIEVVDSHPVNGRDVQWQLDARLVEGPDLRGPYVHGRRGAHFFYLSWLRSGELVRRAKLMLDGVPAEVLLSADQSGLRARFSLSMRDGTPLCAAVRPPAIEWSLG